MNLFVLSVVICLLIGIAFFIAIDLFTNVSQIYGCFFPWDLVTSHFINLLPNSGISILGIFFAYISRCYVGQTLDKLFGCHEPVTFVKWYA